MIAATAVATQLSTIIQYNTIQYNTIQYNTIQYSVQWWSEVGRWLCRVEVDSEQVSLFRKIATSAILLLQLPQLLQLLPTNYYYFIYIYIYI